MKLSEFVREFDNALEKKGKVYVDFKDGFFVVDGISFAPFNKEIVFLNLHNELIGRIDLSKIIGVEEY